MTDGGRLVRADGCGRPAAPVRQVHLGLGAFFRAHQAWYTEQASDRADWGIAAFTGRSARVAEQLTAQDCLYTLVVRGRDADSYSLISSISRAHSADDGDAWGDYLAAPDTSIVSLTVTEAGYRRDPSGGLDLADDAIRADLASWRAGTSDDVRTVPARLASGFAARRAVDAGPITVMSCDNLPANSATALRVALEFATEVDRDLAAWIADNVRAVDTLVDRITPAATPADVAAVRERTGRDDRSPVVTEPYSEWVLGDTFAAARPDWPSAGARLTGNLLPYEQRKLWLLNGAHSLLAYAAPSRGHRTVADAVDDGVVMRWVRDWWDEATRHIALPAAETTAYCDALVERFSNPRMRHHLAQIAADGSQKLPVRVLPVLRRERAAGRVPPGAVRILGGWVAHLRGAGVPVNDPAAGDLVSTIRDDTTAEATRRALDVLDPALAADGELIRAVELNALEFGRP